eukprot:COSAG02_NODE_2489_length_8698_cov_6.406443_5_plen_180_part_00
MHTHHTGGFTIWPGSPKRLYPLWKTSQGNDKTPGQQQAYDKEIEEVRNTVIPVEIVGKAGDVCFWVRVHIHLCLDFDDVLDSLPIRSRRTPRLALGRACAQHHRMVHSGGVNRSADPAWVPEGPQVRMVVPCDYQKDGLTYLESEESNPGPNHQWWVNTRQFAEDTEPTAENMWDNWAI